MYNLYYKQTLLVILTDCTEEYANHMAAQYEDIFGGPVRVEKIR